MRAKHFCFDNSRTVPRSVVGNVSSNRCESGCKSRGRELDLDRSHTFVEIDYEIISMVIILPSAESFKKVCLFVLLLYVPSQLLWSLRDGQFTYTLFPGQA